MASASSSPANVSESLYTNEMIAFALAITLAAGRPLSQDVPAGIRYKKSSAAATNKAIELTKKLLDADVPDAFILQSASKVILCGPGLWKAIKDVAPKSLKAAAPMKGLIPTSKGVVEMDGRVFKRRQELLDFWTCVLAYHYMHKKAAIRKLNQSEMKYYWAIIAWDIEEPVLVVDYGSAQLLIDFDDASGNAKVFYVDILGKLVK